MTVTVWQIDGAWHFESGKSREENLFRRVTCVHIIRVPAGTRDLITYVEIPSVGHLSANELVHLAKSLRQPGISIASTIL